MTQQPVGLDEYVAPESPDFDYVSPSDVKDHLLVVEVLGSKVGIVNEHNDGTKPGVNVNVGDLLTGEVYRSVLWFNPAIHDRLISQVGKRLAIRIVGRIGKSGREYLTVDFVTDPGDKGQAAAWLAANPTAFVKLDEPTPAAPAARPLQAVPAPAPAPAPNPAAAAALGVLTTDQLAQLQQLQALQLQQQAAAQGQLPPF